MQEINLALNLEEILEKTFSGLHSGGGRSSIAGGQSAANQALQSLDISGYTLSLSIEL